MTKQSLKHRKWNSIPALVKDTLEKSSITELDEAQLSLLRLCQLITDIKVRRTEEAFAKENKNA